MLQQQQIFDSPRIANPITSHSLISLLSSQISTYQNDSSHAQYLSELLQFHMKLLFSSCTSSSSFSTQVIESTAVQYLAVNFPTIIPFLNFWHPLSIAYLNSKHLFSLLHLSPSSSPPLKLDEHLDLIGQDISMYYNQFFMARFAAPVLSSFVWLIELLSLPYHQIIVVAQDIPNLPQILVDTPMSAIYTILVHQPIECIAKWLYLLAIFAPTALHHIQTTLVNESYLDDVDMFDIITPHYLQFSPLSDKPPHDMSLLLTLLYNLFHYAIGDIFPLVWSKNGWAYPPLREKSHACHNDVYTSIFSQKILSFILSWYNLHAEYDITDDEQVFRVNLLNVLAQHNPFSRSWSDQRSNLDVIYLKHIIGGLFFPAQISLYHLALSSSLESSLAPQIVLQTVSLLPLTTQRYLLNLLDKTKHDLFHILPAYDPDRIISTSIHPTMPPRLILFLLTYYLQSPSCIPHSPHPLHVIDFHTGSPQQQLLIKAQIIKQGLLLFTSNDVFDCSEYVLIFLQMCDSNYTFAPEQIEEFNLYQFKSTQSAIPPSVQQGIIPLQRLTHILHNLTLSHNNDSVQTNHDTILNDKDISASKHIAECVIMDRFFMTLFAESTTNTFSHTLTSTVSWSFRDYLQKLYNYNVEKNITYDRNDYYYQMLSTLQLNSIEQYHEMLTPYHGAITSGNNHRLQSNGRANLFPTWLPINPFATLVYTIQPLISHFDPYHTFHPHPMIEVLTTLYSAFCHATIDNIDSTNTPISQITSVATHVSFAHTQDVTPQNKSFAEHYLFICGARNFAEVTQSQYLPLLLQCHNLPALRDFRQHSMQFKLFFESSYFNKTLGRTLSPSAPFGLASEQFLGDPTPISPSFYLFFYKAMAIRPDRYLLGVLAPLTSTLDQELLSSIIFAIFIAVHIYQSIPSSSEELDEIWNHVLILNKQHLGDQEMLETTVTTYFDPTPLCKKQLGLVSECSSEHQITLKLLQWENPTEDAHSSMSEPIQLFFSPNGPNIQTQSSTHSHITHPTLNHPIDVKTLGHVTWKPYHILASLIYQSPDGCILTRNIREIINRSEHQIPLCLLNTSYDGLNPIFQCIDTVEKLWLYWHAVDPYLKPYLDHIENLFVISK